MTDIQTLFEMVDNLTPEELQQLIEYAQQRQPLTGASPERTPRILGLHAGMIWISDDFTDPLPDEFWFGEA